MCSGIIDVNLNRDAPSTPWGFRLHGGKDIGFPLVIQRVFMGSPSDGELQRGDTILQVQGRDTADLTHMEAHDIIKAAGVRLQLLIRRLPGAPQTPTTPISPLPTVDGMHPYAKLLRETESSRTLPKAAPMFQPMSPPRYTPQPARTTPTPAKNYCFSPLPTTPILDPTPIGGFFPTPKSQADAEFLDYKIEKYKEKDAIVNQPKFGLLPTPTYSSIGHYSRRPQAPIPHPGALNFERNLNESAQLVHHQYNSPMFLYSQKNIDETIKDQTGVAPAKPPRLAVNNAIPANQSGPLSPGTPGTLAPARPGTKLANIVDITLSPTFQMIHEEEKRSASPLPEVRTPTLPRRAPGPQPTGPRPFEQDRNNAFGSPKEIIHQSGSFKTLMSAMYAHPPAAVETA
uniref:PDZ and LIM domain protein 7 n=1 Tax=Parasteatoda tepidariorum TaxID=114398 RepID=A0A2L2XZD9_PARTP